MIRLTRLNGTRIIINAMLIERIEATPDTVIKLTTGAGYVVQETPDEVTERAVHFLRSIRSGESTAAPVAQLGRLVK